MKLITWVHEEVASEFDSRSQEISFAPQIAENRQAKTLLNSDREVEGVDPFVFGRKQPRCN